MRRYLWTIAAALLLGACAAADHGKGENTMQVKLTNNDGWVYAEWERPEENCEYEVSLFEKGNSDAFYKTETAGVTLGLSDRIAWYYQETLQSDSFRHPMDLVVKTSALKNGKAIAQGESEPMHLEDLFPPKEAPQIGKDIPEEDITVFEWSSNGSSTELIYNYYVSFDPEEPVYYASWFGENGNADIETETGEQFRKAVFDLIIRGELYRKYVEDPDLEILDGSEESLRIEWNGMKDSERSYYRLKLSDAQKSELRALLRAQTN